MRELRLYVYTADPVTLDFSASPVFDAPLNYPRVATIGASNTFWRPWTDDWGKAITPRPRDPFEQMYPQPILTDITFENGNLILGIRDRFGDQSGLGLPFGTMAHSTKVSWSAQHCAPVVTRKMAGPWKPMPVVRAMESAQPQNTGHGPGTASLTPLYNATTGFGSYYNIHRFETTVATRSVA